MADFAFDNKRYAFLDDFVIAEQQNLSRRWYPFEKEVGNPVITKKYDWEGIGPYNDIVFKTENGYVMSYGTYGGKWCDYPSGMATSADGINWTRFDHWSDGIDDDAQVNFTVPDDGHLFTGYKYIGTSFYRHTETSPNPCIRFKKSKDGMHWEPVENSEWVGPSDVLNLIWDENRSTYVLYYKLWKLAGTKTDGSEFCAYFPGFDPFDRGEIFHAEGYAVLPERTWVDVDLVCRSPILGDDGGGGKITEDVRMYRVVARAESKDLLHWQDERVIVESPTDSASNQTYGMYVRYSAEFGTYLAYLQQFNAVTGHIEPILAWSYDGIHFTMQYEQPLLTVGNPDEWDAGMILVTQNLIEKETRQCLYYGALSLDHRQPDGAQIGAIGRAWIRTDGYASVGGGTFTTKPIIVTGDRIFFNLRGKADVEIRRTDGTLLFRFALSGDYTELVPEGVSLQSVRGEEVTVTVTLTHGELFTFGFLP